MNDKLIEWIKTNVEKGHEVHKIRQALLRAGHDIRVVEQHLNHVLKHRKLKEYIKRHVRIGSDIDRLKQYLLNAGYDINIVEEHVNDALKEKKNKKRILTTIIAAISILILIVGFFYYYSGSNKKTGLEIDESKIAEIKYQKGLEIFNRALISNDTAICDEIEDSNLKEVCKRRFLSNISNETIGGIGNESITVKESKELLNKALISRNASFCLDIKDNTIKIQCEEILKK